MGVKGLIARVHKLEPKPSKALRKIGGSIEKFEAEMQAGIDAGTYDPDDMPIVVKCIKRWAEAGY
jgi:hypothetical protein